MFKSYLRVQPKSIQLLVFLSFWFVLMLLASLVQLRFIMSAAAIPYADVELFAKEELFRHPYILFTVQLINQVGMFLIPALLYAYLADPKPLAYLGWRQEGTWKQVGWVAVLGISVMVVVGTLGGWLKEIDFGSEATALDENRDAWIRTYLQADNIGALLRNVLLIAVVPAICEEVFFRGIVQKFVYSFTRRWWLSIGISALVFASFHNSISEFVPILLAGIVLGWVYYYTSSIGLCILMHFMVNGVQVIIGYFSKSAVETGASFALSEFILFGFGLGIAIWSLYQLRQSRTALPGNWSVELQDPE